MNDILQVIDFKEILKILPHRYPFLLIDRILEFQVFKYLKALKNCTISEHCFQGHFIENPIFPGALIIESMAQAAGILIYKSFNILKINELYYFVGIEKAIFKKNVIPGDQIQIEVFFLESKKNLIKFKISALVNHKNICESIIIFYKKNFF